MGMPMRVPTRTQVLNSINVDKNAMRATARKVFDFPFRRIWLLLSLSMAITVGPTSFYDCDRQRAIADTLTLHNYWNHKPGVRAESADHHNGKRFPFYKVPITSSGCYCFPKFREYGFSYEQEVNKPWLTQSQSPHLISFFDLSDIGVGFSMVWASHLAQFITELCNLYDTSVTANSLLFFLKDL